jgi:hypothetical protein
VKYLAAMLCLFSPLSMATSCINSHGDPVDCFPNGSVAEPSVPVGNEGTGLFSSGNGDLRFAVLGVEVGRFDPGGHFILVNPLPVPVPEFVTGSSLTIKGAGVMGSLDSTPIGQTTPAAGAFTALNVASVAVNSKPLMLQGPTLKSGFGGMPRITHSNGTASFAIRVGTSDGSSTGEIAMPADPKVHGWACSAADITTPASNMTQQTGSTPTSVTLTNYVRTTGVEGGWPTGDILEVTCFPN